MANTGDPWVLNVQKWVNEKFSGESGYTEIEENGLTGWNTIYALLHGLQITLEVGSTANNFGTGTINAFNAFVSANGDIKERTAEQDAELKSKLLDMTGTVDKEQIEKLIDQYDKIHGIIQGALLCKGYNIGATKPTGNFYGGTASAIKKLKEDAGVIDDSSVVTLNIMKSLMSMDYFYSYDQSERAQNIVAMQRYLNRNYEEYIGSLRPCDGVYSRGTNVALIYAIQYEENMPDTTANGNCGPATRGALPTLVVKETNTEKSSGKDFNGKAYSTASLEKFKKLAIMALYFNGYGSGSLESGLNQEAIKEFQSKYGIDTTGKIDYTTWLSLLVSCGDTSRKAIACDCATQIKSNNINVLKANGYKYVGRYLIGAYKKDDGTIAGKGLTTNELQILFSNGIRVFPIYQSSANYASYFTGSQGTNDAKKAVKHADRLKIQFGAIIYFAVDYDATGVEIQNKIIPYFKAIFEEFMNSGKGKYRVGVYGTRNLCTQVCEAGYACSSFVSDMSTGFSGNLGFPIPDNWALDQFYTTTISSNGVSIEIDKDGLSGKYLGISQENSRTQGVEDSDDFNAEFKDSYINLEGAAHGRILINRSSTSVPVYEATQPNLNEDGIPVVPILAPAGKILGYIKPNDIYVFYQNSNPANNNMHEVLFNNGTDVISGFIRGAYGSVSITADINTSEAIEPHILSGHEPFTCVEYLPDTNEYKLHLFDSTDTREFYINKPVPYYDGSGNYKGMLNVGDKVLIKKNNFINCGFSRPWTTRIDGIKERGQSEFKNYSGYASIGLEYAGSGSERAWY